jgi:hypothetical protein
MMVIMSMVIGYSEAKSPSGKFMWDNNIW